ncbi:acyl-CoA synthetase, partial [Mycobacterium tuberculosis]
MSTAGDDAVGVPPACGGRSDAVGVPQLARESGAMRDQDCSGELLRSPTHNGHLLVGALKRHQNKPVLFLGDTRLTGGQLADRISQYIQAFEALGAGTGVAVGLLSLNRPEVLMIIGAGQARGYRRTALHPLGSLA